MEFKKKKTVKILSLRQFFFKYDFMMWKTYTLKGNFEMYVSLDIHHQKDNKTS